MINSIFFFQNETSSRSASGANLKIMSLQGGGGGVEGGRREGGKGGGWALEKTFDQE